MPDVIPDRLERSDLQIDSTGESYRAAKARKLASRKKVSKQSHPRAAPARYVSTMPENQTDPSGNPAPRNADRVTHADCHPPVSMLEACPDHHRQRMVLTSTAAF
jgi:hypothetical protein